MTTPSPLPPQPQQPNPDDWEVPNTGNFYTQQINSIRRLRFWATVVSVVVLASLLWALKVTINSFTTQIDKATPTVNLKELVGAAEKPKPAAVTAPSPEQSQKTTAGTSSNVAPSPTAATAPVAVAKPVSVTTAVSVDISSIGNSVVAVVSILVVAIAVLAISLLRTTYTLSVDSVRGKSATSTTGVDTSLPIPGAELVKAIGEALATVLKGLPGR